MSYGFTIRFQTIIFLFTFAKCLHIYGFENSFSAEITNTYQKYLNDFKNLENEQNYLQIKLKNSTEFNNHISTNLNPEFKNLTSFNIQSKNSFLEWHDTNIEFHYSKSTIKAGSFHLKKEGADIFDPLDYFEPKNYMNPLKIDKQALLGFKLEQEVNSKILLEGVYVPLQSITKLPNEKSPWFPRENSIPTANDKYLVHLPDSVEYQIQSNDAKNKNDLKNAWMLKLKLFFSSVDWVFQVAESTSSQPIITPTLNGTLISSTPVFEMNLDNPVLLDFNWIKSHYYGTGIVKTFSDVGAIFKLFYNLESNIKNKDSVAIGIEKQISEHTIILEHSRQFEKKEEGSSLSTTSSLFANTWGLGLRYVVNDQFNFLLGGVYEIDAGSYLITLQNKFKFNDFWYSELSFINLGGTKNSLLNHFDKNDNLSFTIGYVF